jgi:RimJ/RimL family protein N-acetyltransferase
MPVFAVEQNVRMLELAPFTDADIDRLVAWMPDPRALALWTGSGFVWPFTRAQMETHMRERGQRGGLLYKAVDDGIVVGHVELHGADSLHRGIRVARVVVDPAHRGKGTGTTLMQAALRVAFADLRMHRAELAVFDFNKQAIACYLRVGFRAEGTRREMFKSPDEQWWSEIVMGILAREWANQNKSRLS